VARRGTLGIKAQTGHSKWKWEREARSIALGAVAGRQHCC
jgi:hypothetical protein